MISKSERSQSWMVFYGFEQLKSSFKSDIITTNVQVNEWTISLQSLDQSLNTCIAKIVLA